MMQSTDAHMTITVYSHHFTVSRLTPRGRGVCVGFTKPLVSWKNSGRQGYNTSEPDKAYAASDAMRQYFRFHINLLDKFKAYATENHLPNNLIDWVIEAPIEAQTVELKLRKGWAPRDDQLPLIDYIVNSPYPSRLITAQTGFGKGAVSMMSMVELSKRVCIIIQPKYVKKWVIELNEILELAPKDIMVIQGSAALKSLLVLAEQDELHAKIVIISDITMQGWISDYEDKGDMILGDGGYMCRPQELMGHIKAGYKYVDEVHQHFHLLFKIDLYTHCIGSVSMSATMITEDSFVERMYEVMFPFNQRSPSKELKKFIDSYNVYYDFKDPDRIRVNERGSTNYSHNAFEASIIRHVPTLLNYLRLVDSIIQMGYARNPYPGKRLAVYASSTEMCSRMTKWFKEKYPTLDVRRYCASLKDPFKDVIEPDMRFSTLGSSGTAIDIPKLVTVILTIGLSSVQGNIQVMGRLRYIEGADLEFFFMTAANIPKHSVYYRAKREMLKIRAKSFKDIFSGITV